jgi:branched-chain amino acid aminotransferase
VAFADAGFASGATIVDNARTYQGRLFCWPDHLARFRRDCELCHVPLVATDSELTAIAEQLLTINLPQAPPPHELHMVTIATPGPLGFYSGSPTNGPPTLGMMTYPVSVARYHRFYTDGVTLAIAGTQSATAADLLPPQVKHRSRLHWHIADQRVRSRWPSAVAVVLNQGVADTAIGSVVGVMTNGQLRFPPAECVQDSISLKVLRELVTAAGLPMVEAVTALHDPQVVELLLVGTGFGIAGVSRVFADGVDRPLRWPGPMYQRLLGDWSAIVGVDVAGQFQNQSH